MNRDLNQACRILKLHIEKKVTGKSCARSRLTLNPCRWSRPMSHIGAPCSPILMQAGRAEAGIQVKFSAVETPRPRPSYASPSVSYFVRSTILQLPGEIRDASKEDGEISVLRPTVGG